MSLLLRHNDNTFGCMKHSSIAYGYELTADQEPCSQRPAKPAKPAKPQVSHKHCLAPPAGRMQTPNSA